MANVIELQVYYRDKQGNVQSIKQPPSGQDTATIKMDVARIIKPIKESETAEYYYVVVKVRKSDGDFGYRTIIPKTLL